MRNLIPGTYHLVRLVGAFCALLVLLTPVALRAQASTGTITGRVLNEGTGQYLRNASVSVAGTSLSTVAEAGGAYTLTGVPAGQVRLIVSYAGLDPAEAVVTVNAGQTVTRDFSMGSKADDVGVVKLGEFRVTTERDGNFAAIQEQKSALEIKQVVASDAFGDVSEGNVGEFIKLLPGVMMDYVDADVRTVSIGGLDPKYATILMDGAPIASAGSSAIGTGRAFEFEQLSIASIETVELSKTPTPDISGSALSGVVNLRSRGAFDRKGRLIRYSASTGINSHQVTLQRTPGPSDRRLSKLMPNGSLEYSDVFGERLGVIAGVNFSRVMGEQNILQYGYTVNADPTDNKTEVPRLNTIHLIDAPKITSRGNYNLRLDYKLSADAMVWGRMDYNVYSARNYQRNARFILNNAINGPAAADPRDPAVEYSLLSQTSTNATVQLHTGNGFNKHGATVTPAIGGSYRRGAFRAEAQAQMSRSTNFYHDVPMGFFNTSATGLLPATIRWNRASAGDAGINVTQLAGADWRRIENYPGPNTMGWRELTGKDQKWTAKTDMRYSFAGWKIPVVAKWGGDIAESIRNIDRFEPGGTALTYLGPDGQPNTGDETWTAEPNYTTHNLAGGNLQSIPAVDRFARAREYGAHPERFTSIAPAQELMLRLRNHWDVKEQVDSLYSQIIFKLTSKLDVAPGVRMEKTRSTARGPTDLGDDHAKRVLTGNPLANIPTNTAEYYQARYGTDSINHSDYHTWLKYLHATYRITNDFVLRASFNNSITRPDLEFLTGSVTINEDATPHTANISNPNLQPEHGRNLFFAAEYYFPKRAGFFTVTGTRRDIDQLIRTSTVLLGPDEDFPNQDNIDLRGFRVTTRDNVAKAHVSTVEFSYRQNMVFLPGMWNRLSAFANYTVLHFDDYENFRRPENLANGGISFDHPRGLSFRWNVVWVPIHRRAAIPANGWVTMTGERLAHDMNLAWRFSSRLTVFANVRNIFNRAQRSYLGPVRSDLLTSHNDYGAFWNIGVRGQF